MGNVSWPIPHSHLPSPYISHFLPLPSRFAASKEDGLVQSQIQQLDKAPPCPIWWLMIRENSPPNTGVNHETYSHIVEKSCTTKRMVETLQWDMGRINQQSTGVGFRNHPQYWGILGIQLVNDAWWMISHTTPCFFWITMTQYGNLEKQTNQVGTLTCNVAPGKLT